MAAVLYRILDTPEAKRVTARPATSPHTSGSRPHGSPPLSLDLIDHLNACGQELMDHARESTMGPLPAPPADRAALYSWAREQADHTGEDRRRALEAIEWRQGVEHALRVDPEEGRLAVRRETCPACGTWGLSWDFNTRVAVCLNRRCTTGGDEGAPTTWTLRQIAHAHASKSTQMAAR